MNTIEQQILHDSDRCVMCGMCLPHCPTYRLSRDEADSPRGRIALLQALARGQLEPTPTLARYLQNCLNCRACEAMCPSEVAYGQLIVNGRRLLAAGNDRPADRRLLDFLASGWAASVGRLAQRLRLDRFARWGSAFGLPRVARLASLLPPLQKGPVPRCAPAQGTERGRVNLFLGCTQALDRETLNAAIRLLNQFGFTVSVPKAQGCCGALHQNAGEAEGFERLARANLHAFGDDQTPILFVASGCGAELLNYHSWLRAPAAAAFSARVREITDFLVEQLPESPLPLAPLAKTVAVHVPCSQAHVLKKRHAAQRLLKLIPEITLVPLPETCCGAAGSHMVRQPELADAARRPHLDAIETQQADVVVSTNIGCALHLSAGLRHDGKTLEVLHPVALLARQLK